MAAGSLGRCWNFHSKRGLIALIRPRFSSGHFLKDGTKDFVLHPVRVLDFEPVAAREYQPSRQLSLVENLEGAGTEPFPVSFVGEKLSAEGRILAPGHHVSDVCIVSNVHCRLLRGLLMLMWIVPFNKINASYAGSLGRCWNRSQFDAILPLSAETNKRRFW
jgi:hypothetical protein